MMLSNMAVLAMPFANNHRGGRNNGPEDYLRGPNWGSVSFLSEPYQWVLGVILALVVLFAVIMAAIKLLGLPGSDRHKARQVGEGLFFAAMAAVVAFMFQDLFVNLFSSF